MTKKGLTFTPPSSEGGHKVFGVHSHAVVPDLTAGHALKEGFMMIPGMKTLTRHRRFHSAEDIQADFAKKEESTFLEQQRWEDEQKDREFQERLSGFWSASTVVPVDLPDPKKDLEVYRYAMNSLGNHISERVAKPEKPKKNDHHFPKSLGLGRVWGTSHHFRLDRKILNHTLASIPLELQKIKTESHIDLLYANALASFERNLTRRADEILAAKISIPDLIGIFSDILLKEAQFSQEVLTSKDLEPYLNRFEAFLSSALKIRFERLPSTSTPESSAEERSKDSLVHHLSAALGISREVEESVAQEAAFAQSQKGFFLEMSANLALIDSHPYYNLSSFPTRDMLDAWKAREAREIHNLLPRIDETAYQTFESTSEKAKKGRLDQSKIRLKIVKARNLKGKDKNGLSDPYCTVEFGKDVFMTKAVMQNLNPIWDEQITLNVQDRKDKVVIQVWDKDSAHDSRFSKLLKDEKDDFLGMVTFSVDEVMTRGLEVEEGWFELKKRSKRSHISGEIYVSIQVLPAEAVEAAAADPGRFMVPYNQMYKYLLKALLKYDFQNEQAGALSSMSRQILFDYGVRYRVEPFFQKIAYFGLLTELYAATASDIEVLHQSLLEVLQSLTDNEPYTKDMRSMLQRAFVFLDDHLFQYLLQYRDCFPLAKPVGSIETSIEILRDVRRQPMYLEKKKEIAFEESGKAMEPEPFETAIIFGLKAWAEKFYQRSAEEASPLVSAPFQKMIRLVDIIMENVEEDMDCFERPFSLIPGLSITRLNLVQFTSLLQADVQALLRAYPKTTDIADANERIQLRHKIFEYHQTFLATQSPSPGEVVTEDWKKVVGSFVPENYFRSTFEDWLQIMKDQFGAWVNAAVSQDKFDPIGQTALHSSSVIDLISSFDQAAKFLDRRQFSDPLEYAQLMNRLAAIFNEITQQYCGRLYSHSVAQFQSPYQLEERHFPLLKSKTSVVPVEITNQNLVKLNNLEALRQHLHQLHEVIGVDEIMEMQQPAGADLEQGTSTPASRASAKGILFLTVIRAEGLKACDPNGKSDPYVLILSNKQLLAKTRTIPKTLNPRWGERFEILLEGMSQLNVKVFDKDMVGSDDLCGETLVFLDGLLDSYPHDIWAELSPQGRILLRLRFENQEVQDIGFYFSYMFRYLKRQMNDMIRLFIDQMDPFINECVRHLVSEARPFLKNHASEVTLAEAQKALEPLLGYLGSNLSVLNESLYADISKSMTAKTWKAVLRAFRLALVPSVEEDILASYHWFHKKRNLRPRQISMMQRCLEVLIDFYHADGSGLEEEALRNRLYLEVLKAIDFYKRSSEVLMKKFLKRIRVKPSSPQEAKLLLGEKELILQILQLRSKDKEAKRFVDDMVKELELERKWAGNIQFTT